MPDWNRGQLADELRNHGFHFLDVDSPRRVTDLIQRAVEELCGEDPWPFNFREESLALPQTIADLGVLDHVEIGGRPLYPAEYSDLRDTHPNLAGTGMPQAYYVKGMELATYPASDEEFLVGYYSNHYWLDGSGNREQTPTNDASVPAIPVAYRDVPVLLAVTYAQADSEDYDEDTAMRGKYEQRLEQMHRELIRPITDEAKRMRLVSGVDWA